MEVYKTNVLIWGMFMTSSMKAAILLGRNNVSNSEIYKNTKFEKIWSVSGSISSLSWARSVFANDQAIKWAKAKVCVYADSVQQMKDTPEAIGRWEGQMEGLRL